MRALWPWLAAVASGVLLALTFAPWNQGWLIWVALTPLLCAVWAGLDRRAPHPQTLPPSETEFRSKVRDETEFRHEGDEMVPIAPGAATKPRPFRLGYVTGVVFYTGAFHWLSSLGPLMRAPILIGLPLLLALYLGLYIGFWAMAMRRLIPSSVIGASSSIRHLGIGAFGACVMVALEWTRGWFLSGFGWDGLGVALHGNLALIQIADVTGVLGLTWLVTFANIMTVVIVRRIRAEIGPDFLKRVRWEFSGTMLVIAAVFSYGVRIVLHPPPPAGTPLHVAAIQPNTPQDEKFDPQSEDRILEKLKRLTEYAVVQNPNLILWPEAPAVRGMLSDEMNYKFMMGLAAEGKFDLLAGTLDYDEDPADTSQLLVYNAAYLLSDSGRTRQVYRKMHLVPFGEFMPLRAFMPAFVNNLVESDLKPGRESVLFQLSDPPMPVAPLICFEDTLGDLTRRTVLHGARLLVNLTNDGWFQRSAGARQHLDNAIFRAVETRRPLVRSTNTGLTGLVDPLGRWQPWIAPFAEGIAARQIDVPAGGTLTFYTRHGDWIAHLSSALFVAWLLAGLVRRRRERQSLSLRSPVSSAH